MKKAFSIIGMLCGAAMACLGLYMAFGFADYFNGSTSDLYTYKADFYTEITQSAAKAVNNLYQFGHFMNSSLGFFFFVFGLIVTALGGAILCYFACQFASDKTATAAASASTEMPAATAETPVAPIAQETPEAVDAPIVQEAATEQAPNETTPQ